MASTVCFRPFASVGGIFSAVMSMLTTKLAKDGVGIGYLFSLRVLTATGLLMILMLIDGIIFPKFRLYPTDGFNVGFLVFVFAINSVIGGTYTSPCEPTHNRQEALITNDVFKFDPFRKRWSRAASMRTPRYCFACSVIAGKVYVAGGRNSSSPDGAVCLAEVYDPAVDRWEELPPMPKPLVNCIGISYMGDFHVLSDLVGLGENTSEVFYPGNQIWCSVKDNWPFSRAMQFSVQVIDDRQLYTLVDSGENLVKTRDSEKEDWYAIGSVPPVHLHNHSRPLEAFDYGFAALNHELYVLRGKVLKWEESGAGMFEIVRLGVVRVFDPAKRPIKWRETRPMCQFSSGSVIGCATLQEHFSSGAR